MDIVAIAAISVSFIMITLVHHHEHHEIRIDLPPPPPPMAMDLRCEGVYAQHVYCLDNDNDGHGSRDSGTWQCVPGSTTQVLPPAEHAYTLLCDDCDDTNPSVSNLGCDRW